MALGQVSIAPEHFRNERNNYSLWCNSFWRELYQNSIDAGAGVITMNIRLERALLPNGEMQKGVFVSFRDDGEGMSTDTLHNVYFRLGATTKSGANIGGNGKARMLTCFSHHAYGIRTRTSEVIGCGSHFEINDRPYVHGCEVWVDVDITDRYGTVDMISALRDYLSYAQMNCEIRCNLPEFDNYSNWLYKRRLCRELSFGHVYVNKSGEKKGELVVRVSGVPMFTKHHRADAQVVIEIDPERNREVLVSNRDSLHGQYDRELEAFLQEIAVDRHSALRVQEPVEKIIGEANAASVTFRRKVEVDNEDTVSGQDELANEMTEQDESVALNRSEMTPARIGEPCDRSFGLTSSPNSSYPSGYASSVLRSHGFSRKFPSLVLYCDSTRAELRKAMWLFNPENKGGKYFGSTKKKLALIWGIAVEVAIEAYLELKEKDSLAWRPGFVFSDECLARHRLISGVHQFLLNPVNEHGKIRFRLNNRQDRIKLVVSAIHEVTHVACPYHDEDFTNMCDNITEVVFSRLSEVLKRMTSVMRGI